MSPTNNDTPTPATITPRSIMATKGHRRALSQPSRDLCSGTSSCFSTVSVHHGLRSGAMAASISSRIASHPKTPSPLSEVSMRSDARDHPHCWNVSPYRRLGDALQVQFAVRVDRHKDVSARRSDKRSMESTSQPPPIITSGMAGSGVSPSCSNSNGPNIAVRV